MSRKDCLRLMAAVTEYDRQGPHAALVFLLSMFRLSKAKDSKARDALLKKVEVRFGCLGQRAAGFLCEDYLDPERIADLMAFASSPSLQAFRYGCHFPYRTLRPVPH